MMSVSERPYLRVRNLPADERRRLALTTLEVVAPYGAVDDTIVDPVRFESWLAALKGGQSPRIVRTQAMEIVEQHSEEPEGRGFYAYGAVVLTLYTAEVMLGDDDEAVVNVAKRLLDLTGAADDEGEVGIYDLAERFLAEPETVRARLQRKLQHHVARL